MARPQLFLTALFLFVACAFLPAAVSANKKTGLFNKVAETSRDLQAPAMGGGLLGKFSLNGFMDKFEEFAEKQWGTPRATLDIDLIDMMRDVFVRDEEHTRLLQQAWGDPEILRALMEDLPLFDVIKPLRALREKQDALTPKDVSTQGHQI